MPLFRFGCLLLRVLLSFSSIVHSRVADPIQDFCSLSYHMMARKGDILYIVGGRMKYSSPYTDHDGPNPILRLLDVSKPFNPSRINDYIRTEEVLFKISGVSGAAFFPTESGFDLSFGRWHQYNSAIYGDMDGPIEDNKWHYEIETRDWEKTGITLRNWFQPNSPIRISSSMTEWIPSLNKGFLFGGDFVQTLPEVTELEHNGLITYDQATNTWTNESTPLRGVSEGGLVHISTATDEILIQFGGKTEGSTSTSPFSEINIYSTTKSKWYTQNLTSDAVVPAPRFSFCTALKSASDGSSHQIYITGGVEPHATDSLARTRYSVWVFSIPSFQWAELNVTQTAMAGVPTANISPKCLAIGKHYIFYYGGELDHDDCDKKTNPAYLLDVNALKWTDDFTPDEGKYEIPPQVIELIGGDKNGGSTKRAPANGWSNPDLATIMALKTRSPGGPGPRPIKARPGSDPCKTNVRAIIGGTVAGVAAVALGFLGWMMFLRRCQGSSSQLPHVNESVVYTAELPAGEIYTRDRGPFRPSTACTRTLGEGDNPAEPMAHTQVTRSGIWVVELQSCEVAREMDTGI